MRTIERSSAFTRDYQRAKATQRHSQDVDAFVSTVVAPLLSDCHIKPDLLPIYRKPDAHTLRLARLGSHSELFG